MFSGEFESSQPEIPIWYDKLRLSISVADTPQCLSIKKIITSIGSTFLLFSNVYTDERHATHKTPPNPGFICYWVISEIEDWIFWGSSCINYYNTNIVVI